jgi:hypothetical protein
VVRHREGDQGKIAPFQAKPFKQKTSAGLISVFTQPGRCVSDFISICTAREEASRYLEGNMPSYDVLVELARICLRQAIEAKNPSVSAELRHLAKGYQIRAASMAKGRLPDIGEE